MGKLLDISNQRFGMLVAIRIVGQDKFGVKKWLCQCDCGNQLPVRVSALRKTGSGATRSCGCTRAANLIASVTTHGHTRNKEFTPEYTSWSGMKNRCHNPRDPQYKNYGARGISVCQEWRESFEKFLAYIGPIPKDAKYTLDRIDNNKGYEPGNVRWANTMTQANNRRNNVKLTALGETLTIPQWSRKVNIPIQVIRNRLLAHWSPERAVTERPRYEADAPVEDECDFWCI